MWKSAKLNNISNLILYPSIDVIRSELPAILEISGLFSVDRQKIGLMDGQVRIKTTEARHWRGQDEFVSQEKLNKIHGMEKI